MKYLTYLAVPYSSPDSRVRRARYRAVNKAFAALMSASTYCNPFSPITHSHPIHELGLNGDWTYWQRVDREYLKLSRRLIVLTLPGWLVSVGVQAEIKIAKKLKIPVLYMDPVTYILSKKP